MREANRWTVPALLAIGAGSTVAVAAEPTQQQLMEQLQALQAKVQSLETQQKASSADVAATIDTILRDAERRSAMFAETGGITAGHEDGKFFIRSADGAYSLQPGMQFQFRGVANSADDAKRGDSSSTDTGFEVRRMKLWFGGNAITPDLTYLFRWEADSDGGGITLEDAWVKYKMADRWAVQVGQFKDPTFHEEVTSSTAQLAVERSLANELIGGGVTDYLQGVAVIYGDKADPMMVTWTVNDGANSDNTTYEDDDSYWGISGRVDYKLMGDWKAYKDFTAKGTTDDLLVVGAGAFYDQAPDVDGMLFTVDAQYENTGGLGAYGALLVNYVDPNTPGEDTTTNWGLVGQVGYMLNPAWEVFGRGSMVKFDEDIVIGAESEDTFYELSVGVNYYLGNNGSAGHRAKITVDLNYLPNGAPNEGGGLEGLNYMETGEDQIVLRAQFQLLL